MLLTPSLAIAGNLTVSLTGCDHDRGQVVAMLYRPGGIVGEAAYRTAAASISQGKAVLGGDDLDYGEYALVVYHDQNGNSTLDHLLGHIPNEPMAFSGSYKMSLFAGKPTFADLAFRFTEVEEAQQLVFK